MQLEAELRPLASLDDAVEEWRDLAARAIEPNIFYEPAFARAAAPVFGADANAVLIWSKAPRRLLGLFLARRWRRHGPFPALLSGWIHEFGPLGTPLVDRDHAEAVIDAWLAHLAADQDLPGILLMQYLPEEGPFAEAFARVLSRRGNKVARFEHHHRALLAPGNDRDGYLERAINAKVRKEIGRKRRRLGDMGPVSHVVTTDFEGVSQTLADFLRLEVGGWKGRYGSAVANQAGHAAFLNRAILDLAREGKVRGDRLCIGDQAVAAVLVLRSQDCAWGWKIAYDEQYARWSPGVVMMTEMTDSLLQDRSLNRVDSTANPDHPMIDHIWRERLALSDRLIALRPQANFHFYLACMLEYLRRGIRKAMKAARDRLYRRPSRRYGLRQPQPIAEA